MELMYDENGNVIGERKVGLQSLNEFLDEEEPALGWTEDKPVEQKRRIKDPEAAAAAPQFRTLSLDDLDNLPDPEWIINGILPADAMTTIFGAPGSTKSFWALKVAFSIASGLPFDGNEVKKGKVIYCVGEGLRGMKWRIEALKLANPEVDVKALEENLIILPRAVMLLDKTESQMLINTAESFNDEAPLRAFIIDTWARSLTGGDENSAQDVGVAINICETVRAKTGASPIIIHHTGADGSRERGSTALRGATDTTIQMINNEFDGIVTVSCKKMKDGEPFKQLRYSVKQFGHSVVLQKASIDGGIGYNPQAPARDKEYYIQKAIKDRDNPF